MLTVNNRNTKKCYIYLKLTIRTPERRHWRRSGVFIVDFKHISQLSIVFLLLNFYRYFLEMSSVTKNNTTDDPEIQRKTRETDNTTLPFATTILSPSFIPNALWTRTLFFKISSSASFMVVGDENNSNNLFLLIPCNKMTLLHEIFWFSLKANH